MKKCGVNTVLYTKDGRKIGNAIVIGVTEDNLYIIKTDYGHVVKNSLEYLNESFYMDYDVYVGEEWDLYKNNQLEFPHKNQIK